MTIMTPAFVGADLGATTCSVGLFNKRDPTTADVLDVVEFNPANYFVDDMRALREVLLGWMRQYLLEGMGVAIAGRLDSARERVLYAGNLTGWERKAIRAVIARMLPDGADLVCGNDAEAQALFEALANPALEGRDFLMWSVGSGIGTARVTWVKLGGVWAPVCVPMEGQHIAHEDVVFANPELCGCGQYNCTERLGSGNGAAERFGVAHAGLLTPEQWDLVAQDQARGMAWLLSSHLVDTVVFGGGVSERQPQLMGLVSEYLKVCAVKGVVPEFVPAGCTKLGAAVTGLTLLNLSV
jgi:predicted NBD/HSP70 family sugar kinase